MRKFVLVGAMIVALVTLTACIGEEGGRSPVSTVEEAQKTHLIGTIPTERDRSPEARKQAAEAEGEYFDLIEQYRSEGQEGWYPEFNALNKLLDEAKIAAYKWDINYLRIYFNDGSDFTFLYRTQFEGGE